MDEPIGLGEFLEAYIEAALWSSTDNADESGGEPLGRNYGADDIDPDTLATMRADCAEFLAAPCGARLIERTDELIAEGRFSGPGRCSRTAYAGHDFWLTRNGHGCGFWEEGDWPPGIGAALDALAKRFGEFNLYIGDDGRIHGS